VSWKLFDKIEKTHPTAAEDD